MAVTYCTAQEVANFMHLRGSNDEQLILGISTDPDLVLVENLINYSEDELDSRLGHAYREVVSTGETYQTHGMPVYLSNREIRRIDPSKGDSVRIMEQNGGWKDISSEANRWNIEPMQGILRLDDGLVDPFGGSYVSITYRYGAATVPRWLKDTCIKMTGIRLIELGYESFPRGTTERWQGDIDQEVTNMAEWKVLN